VAGIEPASGFDVTADSDCTCDFCDGWRAALALQSSDSGSLATAPHDANLQRVISAWTVLPEAIRRAVLAMIAAT
jgi:hypothetical protein